MTRPNPQTSPADSERKRQAADVAKTKAENPKRPRSSKPADPSVADDTIEGEGSPGLTISGGGGHA